MLRNRVRRSVCRSIRRIQISSANVCPMILTVFWRSLRLPPGLCKEQPLTCAALHNWLFWVESWLYNDHCRNDTHTGHRWMRSLATVLSGYSATRSADNLQTVEVQSGKSLIRLPKLATDDRASTSHRSACRARLKTLNKTAFRRFEFRSLNFQRTRKPSLNVGVCRIEVQLLCAHSVFAKVKQPLNLRISNGLFNRVSDTLCVSQSRTFELLD